LKRILFAILSAALIFSSTFAQKQNATKSLSRILFGSCVQQGKPQPIWEKMVATKPDLTLLIGDNIYGDSADMNVLKQKYAMLGAEKGFQKLKKVAPIMATWDDHDFGVNDGGDDYPQKTESQKVFLDFWGDAKDSPRRTREGVYEAKIFGQAGKRVQVIVLDTRYFRSPLKRCDNCPASQGRYVPDSDSAKTMLGAAQWKWFEEQLRLPAEVRIIASSVQVVPEDHGWEKWMNFPLERQRLFNLIRDTKASGVIFISGDRHLAELSMMDAGLGYPLYDLTSSGLNNASANWRKYETNRHRVGTMNWGNNFGMIQIDWTPADPVIALQIYDEQGDINIQRKIRLSTLQPGVIK
jgi:alkaline phosphatase D